MKISRSRIVKTSVLWFLCSCVLVSSLANAKTLQATRKFLESVKISVTPRLRWVGILRQGHLEDRQCQIVGIKVAIKYQLIRFRLFTLTTTTCLVTDQCCDLSMYVAYGGRLFRWTYVCKVFCNGEQTSTLVAILVDPK